MTNYLSEGLKGFYFILVFSFFGNVFGYITRTILARNLDISQFGLFYSIYSLIMFLVLFAHFGFSNSIIKYVSEFKAKKQNKEITFSIIFSSTIMIIFSILISIILIIFSSFIATNFFKTYEATSIIIIFALIIIAFVISNILLSIFKGFQDFFFSALISFTEKFLFMLLVIIFFLRGFNKNIYLPTYALLFSIILTVILFSIRIFKYKIYLEKPKFSFILSKEISSFAIASFLSAMGILIIGYIDTIMITYFRSLEEVGIYNVVLPTVMVLGLFSSSIKQVLAPMVTELWAKKLKSRLKNGISTLRKYTLLLIIPITLIFFIFPKLIINLLFGIRYVEGYLAMRILSIGLIFFTIGFIDITIIRYIGKPKEATTIIIIGVIFNIIFNLLMIPIYGINGAAISTTLSYFLIMIMSSFDLHKFIKVNIPFTIWLKSIIGGFLFVFIVYALKLLLNLNQFLEAIICLIFASIVYIMFCFYFKIIKIKDIQLFIKNFLWSKDENTIRT
jgi:O-antigen/teichoic acid export membrane protein